ncbi:MULTISPECIES: hypothetical protein [Pasteurellaceae]|uniref:DUF4440 domain-containing protein n=1 Tax=Rodentibacter genomosp. 1 TaxID=1908264 RepID=A0A1V3J4F2_9PAST|nr:hypothetical protein [Rodentibacter genomosp. 1]MBF0751438.1 hypothetical protein [Pasteurella sp. 19428wF3_WM03]OOF50040.1 hypothetical protein BKK54_07580 [Rodentibacter genomosp. 1]TFU52054.1 hypothetical protein E4T92_04650 [Pasteurella sp. WM03]
MKLRHVFFSLLLSLTVSAIAITPALYDMRNREAEQIELAELYSQLVIALENENYLELDKLLADGFVLTVIRDAKRNRFTKADWLNNLKDGVLYYDMLKAVKVLPIGKDRLTATYDLKASFLGESVEAMRLKMYFRTKMNEGRLQITRMWINWDKNQGQ